MNRLLLPLRPLERAPVPEEPAPTREPVRRTLDLEPGALRPWIEACRSSSDPCFVTNGHGRLAAMSPSAAVLLDLDDDCIGAEVLDLLPTVGFGLAATPDARADRTLPPLQALASGRTARAVLRLRHRDQTLVTVDVVSSPLGSGAGVLSFVQLV